MSKHKKNMIGIAVFMVISIVLIVHDVSENSEYIIGNILSHAGLFLFGGFLFYLNLKNERRENK